MAHQNDQALDNVFGALSDPTRRDVVVRLSEGPASVKDLAAPYDMALSSFLKHIAVLERAGIVSSVKRGRVRTCRLVMDGFRPAETWIAARRRNNGGNIDRLVSFLDTMRDTAAE